MTVWPMVVVVPMAGIWGHAARIDVFFYDHRSTANRYGSYRRRGLHGLNHAVADALLFQRDQVFGGQGAG